MDVIGIVFTSIGTAIASGGFVTPFIRDRFSKKDKEIEKRDHRIEVLETKAELLEKANNKLELQNLELRVTGQAVNQLLSKLPRLIEKSGEDKPV
jgi:hypothetical protein